jgi:ATP-dependent Lon protease
MSDANTSEASGGAKDRRPVIPENATIIRPVRNMLLFPGMVLPLTIGRPSSIAAAQEAAQSGRKIGLLLQDDASIEQPGPEHLRRIADIELPTTCNANPDGPYVNSRPTRLSEGRIND